MSVKMTINQTPNTGVSEAPPRTRARKDNDHTNKSINSNASGPLNQCLTTQNGNSRCTNSSIAQSNNCRISQQVNLAPSPIEEEGTLVSSVQQNRSNSHHYRGNSRVHHSASDGLLSQANPLRNGIHNAGQRISVISESSSIPVSNPLSLRPPLPPLPPGALVCPHGRPINPSRDIVNDLPANGDVPSHGAETTTVFKTLSNFPFEMEYDNFSPRALDEGSIQDIEETLCMLEDITSSLQETRKSCWQRWSRKYILLCSMCGFSSFFLGLFYLTIYFVLRSYTTSLEYFQTMPIYIPAAVLMLTGVLILVFIRRKTRVSILIKIVGLLCLVCAVLCVVVTVTTTVLHMNRLQTLRECTFYTQLHSCTCLPFTDEDPFELKLGLHITNCDVIHGPLYSCLRALFGVSVIGILVSIFSCMLVYQLLSHERKKMYWEQLENRRRFLYRRSTGPSNSNCNCCEEYGFVSPTELYPWHVWETNESRYWPSGSHLYSPMGEESSNTSRSILLSNGTPTGNPSFLLPWNGTWRNSHPQQYNSGAPTGELLASQVESSTTLNPGAPHSEETRAQSSGVVLRPIVSQGRGGPRRYPPPAPPPHNRRPLSDPGVAFRLSRYPPPFSETFLQAIPYEGLEAFSRMMWDPPPPYSQPSSQENIRSVLQSPLASANNSPHHAIQQLLSSPARYTPRFLNIHRGSSTAPNSVVSSPTEVPSHNQSPLHLALLKSGLKKGFDCTGSLPLNGKLRCYPLSQVKSLGNVADPTARDSLDILLVGDVKKASSIQKHDSKDEKNSQGVLGDAKRPVENNYNNLDGKGDQESELYFADVSSCVSLRQNCKADISRFTSKSFEAPATSNIDAHLYEQLTNLDGKNTDGDDLSNQNSDNTVIVHASSSDHSFALDGDNAYSVTSPLTDQSSLSPMTTDTEVYSTYQASSQCSTIPFEDGNQNHIQSARVAHINVIDQPHHFHSDFTCGSSVKHNRMSNEPNGFKNANENHYEVMSTSTCSQLTPASLSVTSTSDLNSNITTSNNVPSDGVILHGSPADVSLATRRPVPLSCEEETKFINQIEKSSAHSHTPDSNLRSSSKDSTPERRFQSVQDHLFSLKSVNV